MKPTVHNESKERRRGPGRPGAGLGVALTLAAMACAGAPRFHEGPSSLDRKVGYALMRAGRAHADGFAHFWVREGRLVGPISWSRRSQAVEGAPGELLDRAAAVTRLLNDPPREGDATEMVVTFFGWRAGTFGGPIKVGVEVVGRDAGGTIVWMGADQFQIRADGGGAQSADRAAHELNRLLRRDLPAAGAQTDQTPR
jgi:hypothetical protein